MNPTATKERIFLLDALRGFALLGILVVNFPIMSWGNIWNDQLHQSPWQGAADQWAMWLIHYFFEYKFFSLFSLLFGVGFSIQFLKAESKGDPGFVRYYLKRQFLLLLIGLLHMFLLWPGDFLGLYAVLGSLLLFFRKRSTATIFKWAVAMWLGPVVLTTLFYAAVEFGAVPYTQLQADFQHTIAPDVRRHLKQSFSVYPNGNYIEVFWMRMKDTSRFLQSMPFWIWNSFAMFLLGLYAGKRQFFRNLDQYGSLIDRILWICGPLGLIGNVFSVWTYHQMNVYVPSWAMVLNAWLYPISVPTMTLFYVALFCKFRNVVWVQTLCHYLSKMGKMALSHYVLQSLLVNLIVMGFGLGLYGKIPPAMGLLLCFGIWFLQLVLSSFYIGRIQFGPLEWVWRRLTYGRQMP